jgi:hypothetical protein
MKRTKNMIYKETTESRELFLYATNNGELYRRSISPIIENMKKKVKKGVYDSEKAVDAFYNVATLASDFYNRDFGYKFSVSDRFTVAVDMVKLYEELEIFYNN